MMMMGRVMTGVKMSVVAMTAMKMGVWGWCGNSGVGVREMQHG